MLWVRYPMKNRPGPGPSVHVASLHANNPSSAVSAHLGSGSLSLEGHARSSGRDYHASIAWVEGEGDEE
jgi:hypothetical protein